MATATQTLDDLADSLTGFDEIAIKQAFKQTVAQLADDPGQLIRALIFVHRRREGDNDVTAWNAAQAMPARDALDYFPDEDEDSGKDEPPSPVKPAS